MNQSATASSAMLNTLRHSDSLEEFECSGMQMFRLILRRLIVPLLNQLMFRLLPDVIFFNIN